MKLNQIISVLSVLLSVTVGASAAHAAECAATYIHPEDVNAALAAPAEKVYARLTTTVGLGAADAKTWLKCKLFQEETSSTSFKNALSQLAETESQNVQNGSSTLSAASTSLVSKSTSSILGLAEEAGAVSSTTSGNTTTLTVNLQQLGNFLDISGSKCSVITTDCSASERFIRGASLAFSLSPSSQSNNLSPLLNSALQGITGVNTPAFNGLTFQESFRGRKRIVDRGAFQAAVNTISKPLATAADANLEKLADGVDKDAAYQSAVSKCATALMADAADANKLATDENQCAANIYDAVTSIADFKSVLQNYLQSDQVYATARDAALNAVFYRQTFSVEYNLINNAAQPLTSTFKLIYGYTRLPKADTNNSADRKDGQLQFTANGAATIYNSLEGSSESRLRSAQGAVQLDWKPYSPRKLEAEVSAGYYFQYMVANGLLDLPSTALAPGTSIALPSGASTLLNTTGPIHIGQGKLTLSIKGTNFKIPIAVTGASRTDLIKTQDRVGANFGISYDFSSLFSK